VYLKISSFSALAVFAAAALVTQAQTVGFNDVVVGFRPGGSSSLTGNLEIKAGSVATPRSSGWRRWVW